MRGTVKRHTPCPVNCRIEITTEYHLTDVGPYSVGANNQIIFFLGAITQNDVDMIFMRCNSGDSQPKSDARTRSLGGLCEDPMKHSARHAINRRRCGSGDAQQLHTGDKITLSIVHDVVVSLKTFRKTNVHQPQST